MPVTTNQDIIDSLVVLDQSVQDQTAEANSTKTAVEDLTSEYSATKVTVDTELNNVDNTADIDKELSQASIDEFATKQDVLVSGVNISTVNGETLLSGSDLVIERSATSLRTLIYTSRGDLRTPQEPLPVEDDSVIVDFIGQFIYVETLIEPDEDETCFTSVHPNTGVPIGQWLLTLPHPDYLDAVGLFEDSILEDYMEDEELRFQAFNNQ